MMSCYLMLVVFCFPSTLRAYEGVVLSSDQRNTPTLLGSTVTMVLADEHTIVTVQHRLSDVRGDFALLIPVPSGLEQDELSLLAARLFGRLDRHTAPALLGFEEEPPCREDEEGDREAPSTVEPVERGGEPSPVAGHTFEHTGEVNSAQLVAWLEARDLTLDDARRAQLSPFLLGNAHEFLLVKLAIDNGAAGQPGYFETSPLQMSFEGHEVPLLLVEPLKNEPHDILLHIFAETPRKELAGMKNVTMPTELVVGKGYKLADIHEAMLARMYATYPGAVMIEYTAELDERSPYEDHHTPFVWDDHEVLSGSGKFGDVGKPFRFRSPEESGVGSDAIEALSNLGPGGVRGKHSIHHSRIRLRRDGEGASGQISFVDAEEISGGYARPLGALVPKHGVLGNQRAIPSRTEGFLTSYLTLKPWEGNRECEDASPGRWSITRSPRIGRDIERLESRNRLAMEPSLVLSRDVMITRQIPQLGDVWVLSKPSGATEAPSNNKAPETIASSPDKVASCAIAGRARDETGTGWLALIGLLALASVGTMRARPRAE